MGNDVREELVQLALKWQKLYGVAPSILSAISEYDAAKRVGMTEKEYSDYMQDRTAVSRGYDFIFKKIRYQVKAHRPSGKPGSFITNAGKVKNFDWDKLIWIRYNSRYEIQEAWMWDKDKYIEKISKLNRVSPTDMRLGEKLM